MLIGSVLACGVGSLPATDSASEAREAEVAPSWDCPIAEGDWEMTLALTSGPEDCWEGGEFSSDHALVLACHPTDEDFFAAVVDDALATRCYLTERRLFACSNTPDDGEIPFELMLAAQFAEDFLSFEGNWEGKRTGPVECEASGTADAAVR